MSLVLRLALELLPPADGGRRHPTPDGYRASMWFGRISKREDWGAVTHDAVLVFEGTAGAVAPGRRAIARAYPILEEDLPRDLAPGRAFALVEGERTVARARLLERCTDPTPGALRDLAAAKGRPLHRLADED